MAIGGNRDAAHLLIFCWVKGVELLCAQQINSKGADKMI